MDEKENLINSIKKRPVLSILLLLFVAWLWGSIMWSDINHSPAPVAQQSDVAVEQRDIVVINQTVKKVEGKYRYFFDIRNNDDKPFSGEVEIKLHKENGSTLGKGDFGATAPIGPGLGDSVHIDVNTGPVPIFASEAAITNYTYEVVSSSQIVSSGSGDIVAPNTIETY